MKGRTNAGGSGKPEGKFAWAKYSLETVTIKLAYVSSTVIQLTSDDIDLSAIDSSYFVGIETWYAQASYPMVFKSATEVVVGTAGTLMTYTYDPTTARITFSGGISSNSIAYGDMVKSLEKTGYVVSKDEYAYPDGGTKGEHWYRHANSGSNVWSKYDGYTPKRTYTFQYEFIDYSPTTQKTRLRVVATGIALSEITPELLVGTVINKNGGPYNNSTWSVYSTTQLLEQGGSNSYYHTYTYDPNTGILTINYPYNFGAYSGTYSETTKTSAEKLGEHVGYTVDDDFSAYPNGGMHKDGCYYTLLAQAASANVMSLSDEVVASVQQEYRDQIETEVSNA